MNLQIPIINMVLALSSAIDLIDPNISNHHKRVAYTALSIAKQMDFSDAEIKDLVIAGLLHDCGAVNLIERSTLFEFDLGNTMFHRHSHGYKGWFILSEANEFKNAAEIVKYHHIFWKEHSCCNLKDFNIPRASYVLHLADRVDILTNRNDEILKQRSHIKEMVEKEKGTMFMPEAVEAFSGLMQKPYFWFDLVSPYLEELIRKELSDDTILLTSESLLEYANIAHRIIDFRSKFTATHSIGVATSASSLASKLGFNTIDCELMHSAGLMHDLGKLCIPESILEKPGPLDQYEYNKIKSHTYHTYRIIDTMSGLDKVRDWAAYHHEKLDGSGYPFGLKAHDLDLGSRILAVSDMFTALTEERPYRHAMSIEEAMRIINKTKSLDYDVKDCLNKNIEEINEVRRISQENVFESCHEIFNSENLNFIKKA